MERILKISKLKKNIAANYLGRLYPMVLMIIIAPFVIEYLGADAYGLVAFSNNMQIWVGLLTLSMSPMLGREMARFTASQIETEEIRTILSTVEILFLAVGGIVSVILVLSSRWISEDWLNAGEMDLNSIQTIVIISSILVSVRWLSGLYIEAIRNLQRQVFVNSLTIVSATIRQVGGLIIAIYLSSLVVFVVLNAVVICLETLVFRYYLHSISIPPASHPKFSWTLLKPRFEFIASSAYASLVWVMLTNTDRFILAKYLDLETYGYYMIAIRIGSVVGLMYGPISVAMRPRLTILATNSKMKMETVDWYRRMIQITIFMLIPACIVVGVCTEKLLWAWSGNKELASTVTPILSIYVFGCLLRSMSSLPTALQGALGNLRFQVLGASTVSWIAIPLLAWSAIYYGAIGVAVYWVLFNLFLAFIWFTLGHRYFLPEATFMWCRELARMSLLTALSAATAWLVIYAWPFGTEDRFASFLLCAFVWLAVTLSILPGIPAAKEEFKKIASSLIRQLKATNP